MTIGEYFTSRGEMISIAASPARVAMFVSSAGLNEADEVTAENALNVRKAFLNAVLFLLVTPDISEDSYSVRFDRTAVANIYRIEAAELGIPNRLDSVVVDKSYLA